MAKCTLSVEIVRPAEEYRPGDVIDVIVHVDTTDSVKCSALTLDLGWKTHGSGNRDGSTASSQTLFAGQWSPGEEESYRAQVTVPALGTKQPASYHGRHVNVDWYVSARADIPWAFDPKAETRIFVRPDSRAMPEYRRPGLKPTESVQLKGGAGCLTAIAVFGALLGTYALLQNPWFGALIYAPAALAASYAWKERVLRQRIGEVGFGVAPERPGPGGELHGFVELAPPGRLDVEYVKMTLFGSEVAISGSGTQRTTHRRVFFEEAQMQAEHATIEAGDDLELDFAYQIPADLPPSFKANNNSVEWGLSLEVKAQGAKQLSASKELRMGHLPLP